VSIDFELGPELIATEPPEARGVNRDGVRLLVAAPGTVEHSRFVELPTWLRRGDLLVINTSARVAAAVDGHRSDGRPVTVHFSSPSPNGDWIVEMRPHERATGPVEDGVAGDLIHLPWGVRLVLLEPHRGNRLWRVHLSLEGTVEAYLAAVGRPIAYSYVPDRWPLESYQTVFARDPGSAEMPSAGRPFEDRTVTELVARGITIAPLVLHTGVSSLEAGEPPLAERFAVSEPTARLVNLTRAAGGRVVAVGTTVTRALETAADHEGRLRATAGWTDLVLGPDRPARVVTGLITGWHTPGASHLQLLEAVAGRELVELAYQEAIKAEYLWHEFGDSCLLLP
jgi:S-adenosylmethionine:tRNA ribosyltransferase-isomerase